MRAALQTGNKLDGSLIKNYQPKFLEMAKYLRGRVTRLMFLSEAAETCFELTQCKRKNVWRRHVLMQTYYALSTANVHVKNSNRIVYFSYFKEHYHDS